MARKWTLFLDGGTYTVEVNGGTVSVNGRAFATSVEGQTVQVNGNSYTVELQLGRVLVNGIAYPYEYREADNGASQPMVQRNSVGPVGPGGEGAVRAIMPGKVIRVLVSEGDSVKEGDVVLILEAMKMENEIRAHRAGTIKALRASKGADVEMGQLLCEIECGAVDE